MPLTQKVVDPKVVTDSQCVIENEDHVDDVSLQWTMAVIKGPLRTAVDRLSLGRNRIPSIAKRRHSFANPALKKSATNALKPDVTIHYPPRPGFTVPTVLVMGDNKFSGAWSFVEAYTKDDPASMRPFLQVLTYCAAGNTRYGYIMSDIELIATRSFCEVDEDTGLKHWSMEVSASIPWNASGRGKLTVNLAIWWLGVMATNKTHRAIQPRNECHRINTWFEDKDGAGVTRGYTHVLSKRRLLREPVRACVIPREIPGVRWRRKMSCVPGVLCRYLGDCETLPL